jgi:hypothetical protein
MLPNGGKELSYDFMEPPPREEETTLRAVPMEKESTGVNQKLGTQKIASKTSPTHIQTPQETPLPMLKPSSPHASVRSNTKRSAQQATDVGYAADTSIVDDGWLQDPPSRPSRPLSRPSKVSRPSSRLAHNAEADCLYDERLPCSSNS